MFDAGREWFICENVQNEFMKITGKYISIRTIRKMVRKHNYSYEDVINNLLYKNIKQEAKRMVKDIFIEQKLREKGIFDAKDEDIQFIKTEFIDNVFIYKDIERAFEEAFRTWQKRKEDGRND